MKESLLVIPLLKCIMMDIKSYYEKFLSLVYTPRDAIHDAYNRIVTNAEDNAILNLMAQEAETLAKASCLRYQSHAPLSKIDGVPFVIKANIALKDAIMSAGSIALKEFVSPYTATVVKRLIQSGAIPIATTNMDSFAMGSEGIYSAFGATRHPQKNDFLVGGSSSGSTYSVAKGVVPFALGSDTGGSVRLPASHCGVVGYKPTYGALSRYGLIAYASSIEQIGVLATTAEDLEILLPIISGKDNKDMTTITLRKVTEEKPLHDLRLATLPHLFSKCQGDVQATHQQFLWNVMPLVKKQKAVECPYIENLRTIYTTLTRCQAFSNLSRYDGIRYGKRPFSTVSMKEHYKTAKTYLGEEVQKRIAQGEKLLHEGAFEDAQENQKQLIAWCQNLFRTVDFLLLPVCFHTASLISSAKNGKSITDGEDVCALLASLAHLPALSLPCGVDNNGMPVGIQIVAKKGQDYALVAFAKKLWEEGLLHE